MNGNRIKDNEGQRLEDEMENQSDNRQLNTDLSQMVLMKKDNKRHRLDDEIEGPSDISQLNIDVSQMTLMDLNPDCLDKIFRYLSAADLGSISETCSIFQEIAIRTFMSIWKNQVVILYNNTTKGKLDSLRILRQFGGMLQKVNIDFSDSKRNVDFLDIVKKKFKLNLVHQVEFSGFTESASQDKVLNKRNLHRFNKGFTNLVSLRFGVLSDNLVNPTCIQQKLSQLQHLSVQHPFTNTHLANFIKLNPQLKSLGFGFDYSFVDRDLIRLIDTLLPQLEKLQLMEINRQLATAGYQPLYLKNLKRLIIRDIKNGKFVPNLSISNEKLEELDIAVFSCNENLIDTICQYKAVQKLSLNCLTSNFRGKDLIKLSKELPKLSEMRLQGYNDFLPMRSILQFIQEAKHLTKLILLQFTIDMKDIKVKLDPFQWNVVQSHQQLQIYKYGK